jgi:hypothetical protein
VSDFKHRFVLRDGEVIVVAHRQARRVIDKRGPQAPAETAWEITLDSGIVRQVWVSDVAEWTQEPV